jgi:hypothetical protein
MNGCVKCWTRVVRKRIAWLEIPVWELEDGLEAEWTEEDLIYLGNDNAIYIYCGTVRKEEIGKPEFCVRKG